MMIIRLCPGSVTGLFVLLMAGIHAPARAQDLNQDLRRELAELRAEVERLRAEVDALKGGAAPEGAQPAATLEMMQTQVAELAQVKVESTSRMPVKLFGTIHASVFANSDNPNWLDIPNLALAPPAIGPGGTFTASLRQTRLGFTVDGPTLGSARTSGVVAMDFFGGIPGFQTGQVKAVPRLLVAFARIDGARTALEMGQDHVLLAPRDPTSLAAFAFPLLFRSGNLYLRAPHVRVEHAFARHVRAAAGIVAPAAISWEKTIASCRRLSEANGHGGRPSRRASRWRRRTHPRPASSTSPRQDITGGSARAPRSSRAGPAR